MRCNLTILQLKRFYALLRSNMHIIGIIDRFCAKPNDGILEHTGAHWSILEVLRRVGGTHGKGPSSQKERRAFGNDKERISASVYPRLKSVHAD